VAQNLSDKNLGRDLSGVLSLIGSAIGPVMQFVHAYHGKAAVTHLLKFVHAGMTALGGNHKEIEHLAHEADGIISLPEEGIGAPIVEALFRGGLDIDPDYGGGPLTIKDGHPSWRPHAHASHLRSDSSQGIRTLKRLVGFTILLPLAFTALESVLKMLGAQRISEGISGTLGKIPEEIGVSWAMGMALSQILETATGRQLEELVNVQVHPNRLDMMTVRQLARQHHITESQFWGALDLLGYPDDLKALIAKLDTQQLALTDLQTLWVTGHMSREAVKKYMQGMGFSESDVELLLIEYIDKAETSAMTVYRNEVRAAFAQQRISESQFRDMLTQLFEHPQTAPSIPDEGAPHYEAAPDTVRHQVNLEVAAQQFARRFGRTQQTATVLKKLYQSKHLTVHETVQRLRDLGYSEHDADQLMLSWRVPPGVGKPALTSAKVLQYAKSGVFDQNAAYGKLLSLGVAPKDALFLAANPDPKVGPWYPPFSRDTILQAYQDEHATQAEAEAALRRLGLSATEALEALQIAHWQSTHQTILSLTPPGPFPAGTPPSYIASEEAGYRAGLAWEEKIHAAYVAGGVGDQQAVNLLEQLGMSQADAGFTWATWYAAAHGHMPNAPQG
jgi:hypothetical protein